MIRSEFLRSREDVRRLLWQMMNVPFMWGINYSLQLFFKLISLSHFFLRKYLRIVSYLSLPPVEVKPTKLPRGSSAFLLGVPGRLISWVAAASAARPSFQRISSVSFFHCHWYKFTARSNLTVFSLHFRSHGMLIFRGTFVDIASTQVCLQCCSLNFSFPSLESLTHV